MHEFIWFSAVVEPDEDGKHFTFYPEPGKILKVPVFNVLPHEIEERKLAMQAQQPKATHGLFFTAIHPDDYPKSIMGIQKIGMVIKNVE